MDARWCEATTRPDRGAVDRGLPRAAVADGAEGEPHAERVRVAQRADLGFGRGAASETEAPNVSASLV